MLSYLYNQIKMYCRKKRTHTDSKNSCPNDYMLKGSEESLLLVEGLRSGYKEKLSVITDFSCYVKAGEIVGLIGANGAGKSTTIKAIMGLLPRYQGDVKIPFREHGGYAYIPELPALYEELTLQEHLEIAAMASNMNMEVFKIRTKTLLHKFSMFEQRYAYPGTFSKGMRQKLMILCAFLIEPSLYLIDEPFNGLDPRATRELLNSLVEEKKRGVGVLLSTHVLDVAERICDRFIVMDKGKIIAEGNLKELQSICSMPGRALFELYDELLGG